MGNVNSQKRFGLCGKRKKEQNGAMDQQNMMGASGMGSENFYDEDLEMRLLRRAIKRNPEIFILNNLMMCVQFFENYEKEIDHIRNTLVSTRETEFNERLPAQKHVLLPDVLQEHVARNVGFTTTRQTLRPTVEPLQPVRIYVVHDNIEVTEQNYSPHYSSVNDTVTYNMLLKPSENQGYVQLQLLEELSLARNTTTEEELSSIAEGDDELYSDGDSVYGPRRNSRMVLATRCDKSSFKCLERAHSQSCPSLLDDQIIYEERNRLSRNKIYDVSSSHDTKFESDYDHVSSNEERKYNAQRVWMRKDAATRRLHSRGPKQHHRPRSQCSTNRSPASSTSSGYRSGTYAVDSDSDCSCNTNSHRSLNKCRLQCCNEPLHRCGMSHSCGALNICDHESAISSTYNCGSVNRSNLSRKCSHRTHEPVHSCSSIGPGCETLVNTEMQHSHTPRKSVKEPATVPFPLSNAEIPPCCFKKVTYTSDGKIYDPREERKHSQNSKQRRIRQALRRHNYNIFYASSIEFMRHFINLFVDQYSEALYFDNEAVDHVKPEGCVIYCDKVIVSHTSRYTKIEPYEVIPTVWLQWPECAQEWLDRSRSTWPEYDDIKKMKEFGCYIVPEGFQPKSGNNSLYDIEWQLIFPAAERYLETCMTHTQVQVYLMALMLHKTFLRPVFDTIFGLTTAHIRNKLFWMIEENDRPSKWPENRSGECLLKLLESLYHCISQNDPVLPDYFIRDRNLFEKVPSEHLLHTQKQIKRITENPVMYLFHAMENIKHSQKFFPRLNYEMLLKILTVDELAIISPALSHHMFRPTHAASNDDHHMEEEEEEEEKRTYRPGGFWDSAKSKKDQKIYSTARPVTNKTLINPRKATDSIIEISVRCGELEGLRLYALLDFFVRHFIKMAERCHQYGAHHQKIVYLDQAERLSILLSESARCKDDARAYLDKIRALRKRCGALRSQVDPPETPKRNIEAPIFVMPMKDRFSREFLEQSMISTETENYAQPDNAYRSDDHDKRIANVVVHKTQEEIRSPKPPSRNRPVSGTLKVDQPTESSSPRKITPDEKKHDTTMKGVSRMVSLVEDQNDSFLTETTYI